MTRHPPNGRCWPILDLLRPTHKKGGAIAQMEITNYFQDIMPLQVVGVVGFVVYLLAFGAVQCGKMDGNSLAYTLCNLIAASFVGLSLLVEFNLSSALIQISYLSISLIGVFRWVSRQYFSGPATSVRRAS